MKHYEALLVQAIVEMEEENGQGQTQNAEALAQVVALDSQLSCSGRDLCRLPFV